MFSKRTNFIYKYVSWNKLIHKSNIKLKDIMKKVNKKDVINYIENWDVFLTTGCKLDKVKNFYLKLYDKNDEMENNNTKKNDDFVIATSPYKTISILNVKEKTEYFYETINSKIWLNSYIEKKILKNLSYVEIVGESILVMCNYGLIEV